MVRQRRRSREKVGVKTATQTLHRLTSFEAKWYVAAGSGDTEVLRMLADAVTRFSSTPDPPR